MRRVYSEGVNVYDAANERIKFIFDNFPKIYVSFSGGKDSGCMVNLMVDYMRKNGITKKIGLMIMDNEANYEDSLKFMHEIIQANLDLLDVYWCCMPISLPCSVSQYAVDWQCWGEGDKDRWIRPMPENDYIVNINNHEFDFFWENMAYDEFWDKFGVRTRRALRLLDWHTHIRKPKPFQGHYEHSQEMYWRRAMDKEKYGLCLQLLSHLRLEDGGYMGSKQSV